ncbi:MAG: iron-sulfur cluster repair di-iron protein [Candidatus Rifleibacteriota bacterium]
MKNVFEDIPFTDGELGKRKLVDEKHLLAMQIALKSGQRVPEHNANSNVHLLVVEGEVVVTLNGTDTAAPSGSLIPVAFQSPMSIRNDSAANASFLVWKTPHPDAMTKSSVLSPNQTVADLVIQRPELREKLEKTGIDYCCGGKRPLGEAVEAAGIKWSEFLVSMNEISTKKTGDSAYENWNEAPISALAEHILEKHHSFTKEQLHRLNSLLPEVKAAHGARHGELLTRLQRIYDGLRAELDNHLSKEEQILFPVIKRIQAFINGKGEKPVLQYGSLTSHIRKLEAEHDSAGEALAGLRKTSDNYRLPDDACMKFKALYDALQNLEADLHEHIHLENNILFPKSIKLEDDMTF